MVGSLDFLCLYFSQWKGFKLIGDNVDKSVRARHQTLVTTDQSLHYFHSVAVMDCADFSDCSDDAPPEPTTVDVAQFLVTPSDVSALLDRFRTFIKRYVLCGQYLWLQLALLFTIYTIPFLTPYIQDPLRCHPCVRE